MYVNYFALLNFLIGYLSDDFIEAAIEDEFTELEYVELSSMEIDAYGADIRVINGKKVIYAIYYLRNRISKNKKEFYYVDNAIIDKYTFFSNEPFFAEDLSDKIKNYVHFRTIYYGLKNTFKELFQDDIEEKQTDNEKKNTEVDVKKYTKNPYPHIFVSDYAFHIFSKYVSTYKDENNKTANFSFLFHAMQKDELIHKKAKRIDYIEILSKYDINIDKVKTLDSIGNKMNKELAYNSLKNK